ncbi:MAG: bifunctional oligoribonuclease/PAP phosphatase NrnA, partial [Candidatus Saelkia tenebricola]|nr:bifunctional oligoribonuclease/PAP phosphatase NrnA [Candidatus Saelkia tenebricola]
MKIESKIKEKILKSDNFLITAHIHPEGDAIGSELIVYRLLRKLGKKVRIVNDDLVPENLKFLPYSKQIKILGKDIVDIRDIDVFIVVDSANPERTGGMKKFLKQAKCVINIDHHISNSRFGDLNWIDKDASCAGEMLYSLCKSFNITSDYKISLLSYVAILTDTGSFRYENTSPQTHKIASELLLNGVDSNEVYNQIFENKSIERLHIVGNSLLGLKKENGVGWISIRVEDLTKYKVKHEDLEGIIDFIRSLKDIQVAVVFQETKDNIVKISFRSKDKKVDVNKIAALFGGGGHKMASGCRVKGSLTSVQNRV